jgi:hypothetical protein
VISDLLDHAQTNENFKSITSDKIWVDYDPKTNQQSPQWKHPSLKGCSKTKVMLILFFDCEVAVYHKYVPQGQTVKPTFYLQVLKCL